jgi:hypothetical protein
MDQAAAWTNPVVNATGFLFYVGSYSFAVYPNFGFLKFSMLLKAGLNNNFY